MDFEEFREVRNKMFVVQRGIQNSCNNLHFEIFINFLGSLRKHSRRGESFNSYQEWVSVGNIRGNLVIYNEYLVAEGEEPLTEKDVEQIYYAFRRR